MCKDRLVRLHDEYPECVQLYQPASTEQLRRTEQQLGIPLADLDPDWPELLRLTNGAGLLDFCFQGALSTRVASITSSNVDLCGIDMYEWRRTHFVEFAANSAGEAVGFVREGPTARCVAYMSEPGDAMVLPLSSTFERFMVTFLEDVERTLRAWKPLPQQRCPYDIPGWPFDLRSWYTNDPQLVCMLRQGQLDDVFRGNRDYAAVVDQAVAASA